MDDRDPRINTVVASLCRSFPALKAALSEPWKKMSLETHIESLLAKADIEERLDMVEQWSTLPPDPKTPKLNKVFPIALDAFAEQQASILRIFEIFADPHGKVAQSLLEFLPDNIDRKKFNAALDRAIAATVKKETAPTSQP